MEKGQTFEAQCQFARSIMGKEECQGRGEGEINQMLKQRIKKFYATSDYIQVDEEHFKPRIEPLYIAGVEPSSDTLLLFGIDFMKKVQLKDYFAHYGAQYHFLDESNCMIAFPSPQAALEAIRANVRPDSNTKFKVEDDSDQVGELGLNLPHTQPRQWIELRPYIFEFYRNKFQCKTYQRKLYVRYATNKEKQAGFDRISFLDELIARCKLIWENQARKDEQCRKYLEAKIQSFKERIRIIREGQQHQRSERSRSRDKRGPKSSTNHNNSRQQTLNTSKRNPLLEGADEDLSYQIRSRCSNSSDLQHLVSEFGNLHVKQGEISIVISPNMLKEKRGRDATGMSGAPEVGYKLVQPASLRVEFKHEHFDYRKYVQENLEKAEKQKVVSFCDLTEDD